MSRELDTAVVLQPDEFALLRRAADRSEIVETIGAYGFFLDTNDWEAFAELFADDAAYDISPDPDLIPLPLHGREAIVAAMRERREKTGSAVFPRHLATNVVFRHLDAERAATSSFLVVVFTHLDGRTELRRTGTYVDELCKDGGRWRFSRRHLQMDTAAPPPEGQAT